MKKFFITGIDTNVGKTIISSILVEKFQADYWKPIQAGDLNNTDSMKIDELVTFSEKVIHDEAYRLKQPLSPHAAAELDNIDIRLDCITIPKNKRNIIIEGAGGLMVPLNKQDLIIDLIAHLEIPVILVSKHYLGSINHTILSIESLLFRKINVKGIIFNGIENKFTESIIKSYCGVKILGRIPLIQNINKSTIKGLTNHIKI